MKKFGKLIAVLFGSLMMFGCADFDEAGSDSSGGDFGTLYFGSKARFVDVDGISNATVNVYGYGMEKVSKTGVAVNGGKGDLSIEKIPVGKNRVIEVVGNKADGVPVKILYAVTDINAGGNTIGTIKDGSDSAKGKAYLSLLNAKIDISSVSLNGFEGVKSAYLFDSEGFAASYKKNSSASPADFIQKTGTVKFTNIQSAAGYSVWIDDPLSGKLSIDSDSVSTKELGGVAPGTWNVYANDGKNTAKIGNVTIPSGGSADFSGLIGNALVGRLIIFVKADSAPTIWAWQIDGLGLSEGLGETWATQKSMISVPAGYMNNPDGWFMKDFTAAGKLSGNGKIHFKLNKGDEKVSDFACTFWYDGDSDKKFYDSDPTTAPVLSSDATLKEIKVNGTSIGVSESYEVSSGMEKVLVSAAANSSKATVSVNPGEEVSIESGKSKSFEIVVTAEDGTKKSYSLSVTRKAENPDDVTLSSIKVNGISVGALSGTSFSKSLSGAEDTLSVSVTATASSSSAKVTVSPETQTLADGKSQEFKITVTNGTASQIYTLTVDYTKTVASSYYWTNKNGAVGTNKTISGLTSWTESEKIIQSVACDTPRCWLGGHEYPDPDLYSMFAAWDDTNLYLMIELPNVDDADALDSDKCYAGAQFLPMGIVMNTGKRTPGDGTLTDGSSVWQSKKLYSWEAVDTMLMFHPRLNIGEPSVFLTDSTGKFTYTDKSLCIGFKLAGVERNVYFNESVSDNMWAAVVDSEGNWGGKVSTDMTSYNYIDYKALGKKMTAYQITIPLKIIGIDKSYIESVGISVGAFSTYGASAMDCLPWDNCMIDCAAEPYSSDPSSSKEKEDVDTITSALARIGHM